MHFPLSVLLLSKCVHFWKCRESVKKREKSLLGIGRPGQAWKKCAELSGRCIWDIFLIIFFLNFFLFFLEDDSFVGWQYGAKESRWQSGDMAGAHHGRCGTVPPPSARGGAGCGAGAGGCVCIAPQRWSLRVAGTDGRKNARAGLRTNVCRALAFVFSWGLCVVLLMENARVARCPLGTHSPAGNPAASLASAPPASRERALTFPGEISSKN